MARFHLEFNTTDKF